MTAMTMRMPSMRRVPSRLAALSAGVVAAVIAFTAAADGAQGLLGAIVPPYPAGLDALQGGCVPGGPAPSQVCDHGLSVVGAPARDARRAALPAWVLATRNLDPAAERPRWRVTDVAAAPQPRKGYELQIGGCRIGGVDAAGVVAFVQHGKAEYSRHVAWARDLDIATGRLAPVALKRVDCVNPGYGL